MAEEMTTVAEQPQGSSQRSDVDPGGEALFLRLEGAMARGDYALARTLVTQWDAQQLGSPQDAATASAGDRAEGGAGEASEANGADEADEIGETATSEVERLRDRQRQVDVYRAQLAQDPMAVYIVLLCAVVIAALSVGLFGH